VANRLTKLGKVTYVPGVQGRQAVPAYCTEVKVDQSGTRAGGGGASYSSSGGGGKSTVKVIPVIDPFSGAIVGYEVQISGGNGGGGGSGLTGAPQAVSTKVCYPAVTAIAAVPSRVLTEGVSGWNGGASSNVLHAGDILASFKLPTHPVGIVIGFAAADLSTSFAEATHAFFVHAGAVDIIERGATVFNFDAIDLTLQPTFYLLRQNNAVTYHVAGQTYKSAVQSGGAVVLDASLYSTGDYIDDPVFEVLTAGNMPPVPQTGEFDWYLPSLAALLGGAYAALELKLPQLFSTIAATQTGITSFAWSLPTLDAIFGRAYTRVEWVLPLPTISLEGGYPIVAASGFNWILPPLQFNALMFSGGLLRFWWDLPALAALIADRPYAAMSGALAAMTGYLDDGPRDGYGVMENLELLDFVVVQPIVFMVVYDGLEFADNASIVLLYDRAVYDGLALTDSATPSMIIEAMVRDGLAIGDSIEREREALQYAVNIATGALTSYQNFDFLGFVKTNNAMYGYRADGLYAIGAATDDGALLDALLDLGAIDPGTNLKQRMEGAFLGLSTDGAAFLRLVGDDGQEWLYSIDQHADAARAKFGRGLQSREWRVSLHLTDASTVDLQSIEFLVHTAVRRWKR
jgi:hypothetical protein